MKSKHANKGTLVMSLGIEIYFIIAGDELKIFKWIIDNWDLNAFETIIRYMNINARRSFFYFYALEILKLLEDSYCNQ